MSPRPRPPAELKASGRKLWNAVQAEYELEQHETRLLREMCRAADVLDRLATIVETEGEMLLDRFDQPRIHPALVESRQLKVTYARLSAALRLPAGEEGDHQADARRPQRRVGVRGTYGITGSVS